MSDLQRWLDSDGAPQGALDLLRSAQAPTPLDAGTRARSRRRLAAMAALPAAASMMFWLKSVALGAVLGGAATVAVVVPKWRAASELKTSISREAPHRVFVAPGSATIGSAPLPTAQAPEVISSAPAAPSQSAPSVSASSTTKSAASITAISSDDLGREIQLLERARQLLSANPALALATLDQHRREFGKGTLGLERQFLEVDALLRLGRRGEARARAANLRARAPGSLYEQRLSKLLDESNE